MTKRYFILTVFLLLCLLPSRAQEATVKREVTLYNPYKPSLNEFRKKSFLPEMNDTAKFRPDFRYDVNTTPFMPAYTVSPIKAATLSPDPLTKLYRSYVNLGFGSQNSPLAEISITNERSKKGSVGFYGRHFSNNGRIKLDNGMNVFGGYMDNDASLFGRKFFRSAVLGASADLIQKSRFAYGYDPAILNYFPKKKDMRLSYSNIGAKITLASLNLDSADFSYDFNVHYNYFVQTRSLFRNNFGFSGLMAKEFRGFYAGSGLEYDHYRIPDILFDRPEYIASISPFVKKSSPQWNFKLGFKALLERNMTDNAKLHLYPDLEFGISMIPSYLNFFTGLSGKLERNDPLSVLGANPFLVPDGSLFTLPNTDHKLSVIAGLKGNTGIGGNYLVSASYTLITDMLFFSNIEYEDSLFTPARGNLFVPLTDDVDLINIHGEMTGKLTGKLSYGWVANYYKYTLTAFSKPWNKPEWDASFGLKYNLRDKIIAGMDINALGKRSLIVNGANLAKPLESAPVTIEEPYHINLNLSAEYRYSKILSFWTRINNISYKKYYEWAYYPTHRYLFMVGFTYSL